MFKEMGKKIFKILCLEYIVLSAVCILICLQFGGGVGRFTMSNIKKKANTKVHDDVLTKMWNGVRLNNGIMVLLKLLGTKTPITDADSLRALACKVG